MYASTRIRTDSRPATGNTAQRVRVEVADGGVLFLDCSLEPTGTEGMAFAFTGVMDASQLKGPVGSVVGCTIEEE